MSPARRDPVVSVVMPVAPGRSWLPAVRSLAAAAAGGPETELIVVSGTQPSQQRNLAAQEARGEYLYFIDNDSHVQLGTIGRLVSVLRATGATLAGGPTPGRGLRTWFSRVFDLVVGSPVGSPLVFRRYRSVGGTAREAGERSLMLCNLMARREDFLAAGGFDPRLYPNEENELVNRMRAAGARAVRVGKAEVRKPRDHSPVEVLVETWRYGRGRMEQIWTNPHWSDLPFVVMPLVALAGLVAAFTQPGGYWLVVAYALTLAAEAARLGVAAGAGELWRTAPAVMTVTALRHLAWLAGAAWGAVTGWRARGLRIRPRRFEVRRFSLRHGRARVAQAVSYTVGFHQSKEDG